jgi:hypothetical protein
MKDSVTLHVAIYLLLKASHKDHVFPFNRVNINLQRGQLITGRDQISRDTGITTRQIRTRLEVLRKKEFLTIKPTNRYSIISVCNYGYYQDSNQAKRPRRRPTGDQLTTTYNKGKNEKIINIECNDFERLEAFLLSLPEFISLPLELRDLIQEFINKVRGANKTKTIREGRISELLHWFRDILDRTDEESLFTGLKKAFRKMEKDGFDFKQRNPTGYVRSVAKSHKAQKDQTKLLTPLLEQKEELQKAPEGEIFQDLKTLIGGAP